jgi:hypothetical protein
MKRCALGVMIRYNVLMMSATECLSLSRIFIYQRQVTLTLVLCNALRLNRPDVNGPSTKVIHHRQSIPFHGSLDGATRGSPCWIEGIPYFPCAIVGRTWSSLSRRTIVEYPVDSKREMERSHEVVWILQYDSIGRF